MYSQYSNIDLKPSPLKRCKAGLLDENEILHHHYLNQNTTKSFRYSKSSAKIHCDQMIIKKKHNISVKKYSKQ